MSAEPADPRCEAAARAAYEETIQCADAYGKTPWERQTDDVRDFFRHIQSYALAAADAVITPPPDASPKSHPFYEPLAKGLAASLGDNALVMSDDQDVHLVAFIAIAELERLRAAVLSPPPSDASKQLLMNAVNEHALTEYEQVGWHRDEPDWEGVSWRKKRPLDAPGWEPVFRRVRDDPDAREAAAWEAALADGDLGAGASHKPPRRVRDENEKTK